MSSRDILNCAPALQKKYYLLKEKCEMVGLKFILTCTSRLYLEQFALYAQGRESLEIVNHLRNNIGMAPIDAEGNKHVVTWTMNSKHIIGDKRVKSEAFDIALVDSKNKIYWNTLLDGNNNKITDYLEIAKIGQLIGLKPGAFFKDKNGKPKPDYAHFEI